MSVKICAPLGLAVNLKVEMGVFNQWDGLSVHTVIFRHSSIKAWSSLEKTRVDGTVNSWTVKLCQWIMK